MSMTSLVSAPTARRLRAASPALHGGASSMLRLARGSDARLPSCAALSGWAERAAAMLDLTPMVVGEELSRKQAGATLQVLELPLHQASRGVSA